MAEWIPGPNAVLESLKNGDSIQKLYIAEGKKNGPVSEVISLGKRRGVPVQFVPVKKMDALFNGRHQGVLGEISEFIYSDIDDILEIARSKGEPPFILMLSEIESPHNLGAIIRTAEIAGVHGIIIPKNNAVGVNSTVAKTACGAVEYMPVARVTNLVRTAEILQKEGLWVYGADMDGADMWHQDLKGPVLLVIGGEDKGIPRLLKEKCDFIVSIPMSGHISSLNASVAAGVLIYEVCRQRSGGIK